MTPLDKLKTLHANYLKAGKLIEAKAIKRAMALIR